MNRFLSFVLLASLGYVPLEAQNQPPTKPVLVELFTSEGCSSCPPADALLVALQRAGQIGNAEVIPIGLHVDYWNGLGWNDRFSDHEASLRQERYAELLRVQSPYTPQIVVDGHIDALGNERASVLKAIVNAASDDKPARIELKHQPSGLEVAVQGAPRHARVMLAITEDNLSTSVRGGENRGHELHHTAVVRSLKLIGETRSGQFAATIPLKLRSDWKPADIHVIVFAQEDDGRVTGASMIPIQP